MNKLCLSLVVPLCLLIGCALKPQLPGNVDVVISKEPAPAGCTYLGEVQGKQGNLRSAEMTSDAALIDGARNEVRNAAHALHGNYVKVETESFSHNMPDDSPGEMHTAVVTGNAYRCSEESLAAD